jgi:hypothetical protein
MCNAHKIPARVWGSDYYFLVATKKVATNPKLPKGIHMATENKTNTPKAPKKEPIAISVRVTDQLTRAVLAKKITKGELQQLHAKVEKLIAFTDV